MTGPLVLSGLVAALYVGWFLHGRSTTVPLLRRWAWNRKLVLDSWRPFIPLRDGMAPPFVTWAWRIFRVRVRDAEGTTRNGWARCDCRGVLVIWDTGKVETMSLCGPALDDPPR